MILEIGENYRPFKRKFYFYNPNTFTIDIIKSDIMLLVDKTEYSFKFLVDGNVVTYDKKLVDSYFWSVV